MASKPPEQQKLLSFPLPEQTMSLLAFQFDEQGQPRIVTDFASSKDKLALLLLAQSVVAELVREAGCAAVVEQRHSNAA